MAVEKRSCKRKRRKEMRKRLCRVSRTKKEKKKNGSEDPPLHLERRMKNRAKKDKEGGKKNGSEDPPLQLSLFFFPASPYCAFLQ